MSLIMVEELLKSSLSTLKRELRSALRGKSNYKQQKVIARNTHSNYNNNAALVEVLAQQGGSVTSHRAEDGTVKMKIVIKKQDLKRMLEAMNNANNNNGANNSTIISPSSSSVVERRLCDLMMRRRRRASQAKPGSPSTYWRPALQSIPEEH